MKKVLAIAALLGTLIIAGNLPQPASAIREPLRRSAAITTAIGYPTTCTPHWQRFLRAEGIQFDAAWIMDEIVTFDYQVTHVWISDVDCVGVLKSSEFDDFDVAVSLYYMAELAATNDSEYAIERAFYQLRPKFHIRRSVTVDDFFPSQLPEPDPRP